MQGAMEIAVFLVISAAFVSGRQGFGPGDQEWGHVTVREGAHMFWWLFHTTANVTKYTERPLVIWLQGGPGTASTGDGIFKEIGPLREDLGPRNSTWLSDVNVMFVDNPVGTGWSYVDSDDKLTKNIAEICADFLVLLQEVFKQLPELRKVPLYIFGESYGGKMAPEIAVVLDQAVKNETLEANLKGVAIGSGWVSPVDSVMGYAPFLLQTGEIDQTGYEKLLEKARKVRRAVDKGKWRLATMLWRDIETHIWSLTGNVDFYNILKRVEGLEGETSEEFTSDDTIDELMNKKVKKTLGLNITSKYHIMSRKVFGAQKGDFMKPSIGAVELLLNNTDLEVAIYSGQLDLIVNTPGTVKWVDDKLRFPEKQQWKAAERKTIVPDKHVEGFVKKANRLAFYWVLRAGHQAPSDNPDAMRYILRDVTKNFTVTG